MSDGLLPALHPLRGAHRTLLALGLIATVLTILQMWLLSHAVGSVFRDRASLDRIAAPLELLVIAITLRAVVAWVAEVVAQRGAAETKALLRQRLVQHLASLGPTYMAHEEAGELATTALDGVNRLDAYLVRYLPQRALSVAAPLLIAGVVLRQDVLSGVLLLATAPLLPLLMVLVGSYAGDHIQTQWTSLGRMSAHLLDALHGLPTLRLFGRGDDETARVTAISEEFRVRTLGVLRYAFLNSLVLEFMTTASIALVAVELGSRLLTGGIGFEPAFWILLLAPEYYRPLRELGTQRHAALEGKAAASRISTLLSTPAARPPIAAHAVLPAQPLTVELDTVSVRYANGVQVLEDITLALLPGTRTALVGHTGAGKTTLVNLLMGYLEPAAGTIRINGVLLPDLAPQAWRTLVALVPQRPYLFDQSVRENIRLGRIEATDDEVARAAQLAGADGFIASLSHGYDTRIGERGMRLSGGQAQRLAIARAFLKDAPLLILDEPTAYLDPESERGIHMALDRLMQGRTVLLVAHRMSTVYTADQIAVLAEGRLAEIGRHDDLMRRHALYYHLIHAAEEQSA